jgi:hypothetical protein
MDLTVLLESHRKIVAKGPDVHAVCNPAALIDLLMAHYADAAFLHNLFHFIVA